MMSIGREKIDLYVLMGRSIVLTNNVLSGSDL